MEKWEYKSLRTQGPQLEETLRPLGEQGWEVVNFAPAEHSMAANYTSEGTFYWAVTKWSATDYRVLLKRRKS